MKEEKNTDQYDAFVEKFKPKKTTDDCYTPPEVYECVLNYVKSKFNLAGHEIVRPFYPGGDYESFQYPKDCIVIDNPPFSIITPIVRYYNKRGIKFFLFAPHITLFTPAAHCTAIVAGADVTYENGAIVKTSFLSNLYPRARVIGDPALAEALNEINDRNRVNLPKYVYPVEVLTVSMVQQIISRGIYYEASVDDCEHIKSLESQRKQKKSIFGSGFLLSEKAAAEKAAAEKAAAEKDTTIVWELSGAERERISLLGELE